MFAKLPMYDQIMTPDAVRFKKLLVFCDGIGIDSSLSDGASRGGGCGSAIQSVTNVFRLAHAVRPYTMDQRRQMVFYQSGIGAEGDIPSGPLCPLTHSEIRGLGPAIVSKICNAYAFIVQNFKEGDEIYLFGFSRGAYAIRKLSELIDRIGLLGAESLGLFMNIWREIADGRMPSIPPNTRRTNIKCIGLWDTVGTCFGLNDALRIQDTCLPATVGIALHAVALQENRMRFLPTLWRPPPGGLRPGQVLKQVWFPGAHSDVGGGYKRQELADLSLFWMAGETQQFINYDLDSLQRSGQGNPQPWGTPQPHNAYSRLTFQEKLVIGHRTRPESHDIHKESLFHPSLGPGYAPTTLDHPEDIVTMETLKMKFGNSWTPVFTSLNEFEEKCKREWDMTKGAPHPTSASIDALLGPARVITWTNGAMPGFIPPTDALMGGHEDSDPGKLSDIAKAVIGWDGKEVTVNGFEILIANDRVFTWVKMSGQFSLSNLHGAIPFQAGNEADGRPLYVARANIPGTRSIHCGKVNKDTVALIPYDGDERSIDNYEVLVYANNVFRLPWRKKDRFWYNPCFWAIQCDYPLNHLLS